MTLRHTVYNVTERTICLPIVTNIYSSTQTEESKSYSNFGLDPEKLFKIVPSLLSHPSMLGRLIVLSQFPIDRPDTFHQQ